MKKKVIIIGAGIAGLSAGSYLQMNGYDTEIFELHYLPGGLCTAWEREGYVFDTCIHWLVGSHPKDPYYKLWNEIVDMKKLEFVYFDKYMTVFDPVAGEIKLYSDLDSMKAEFLRIGPEDELVINELFGAAKKLLNFKMYDEKAPELKNIFDKILFIIQVFPYLNILNKYVKQTSLELSAKFTNPILTYIVENMFVPEMASIFSLFILKWFHEGTSGYPIGGSLNFAKLFEKRYLELGGKIHYRCRVNEILTSNGKVVGIRTHKGELFDSDIVISAADGHSTLFDLLDCKYLNKELTDYFDNHQVFSSYLQVSLGISKDLKSLPPMLTVRTTESIKIDPETETNSLGVRIYNFDKTMAPEGKTAVTVLIPTYNYKYWQDLRKNDHEEYHRQKSKLAELTIDLLEENIGNIRDYVEVIDVSSPATVIRYTENWKGSFEGWVMTPKLGFSRMKKTIKGLDDFYMIGQWVEPGGGLPTALLSARNAVQIICKKDGKKFQTIHF